MGLARQTNCWEYTEDAGGVNPIMRLIFERGGQDPVGLSCFAGTGGTFRVSEPWLQPPKTPFREPFGTKSDLLPPAKAPQKHQTDNVMKNPGLISTEPAAGSMGITISAFHRVTYDRSRVARSNLKYPPRLGIFDLQRGCAKEASRLE